jgi:hypothetical protein
MSRKTLLLIVLLIVMMMLVVTVGVSAQGGNGNNGGGNGNGGNDPAQNQNQTNQQQTQQQNRDQSCDQAQDCDPQGNQTQAQNGPGGPNADDPNQYGFGEPQYNAYRWGGMGFANANNGAQWNGQMRGAVNADPRGPGVGYYAMLPPISYVEITAEHLAAMTAGLNDERNAYAIYEAVVADFGEVRPFINIMAAEAQHMAAWEFLFDRYGLELPEAAPFDVPHFSSVQDACAAAADAEIMNFGLYDDMMATLADFPDMVRVITALRDASEYNHLPAFENCAG